VDSIRAEGEGGGKQKKEATFSSDVQNKSNSDSDNW